MKKPKLHLWILWAILPFLVLILMGVIFSNSIKSRFFNDYADRSNEPIIGYFDRFSKEPSPNPYSFTYFTLIWRNTAIWFNNQDLEEALGHQNTFITIETWSKQSLWGNHDFKNVLKETLDGKFDDQIKLLGQSIQRSKHPVYVSWNPEMEVPALRYPWQFQPPALYNQAFNHFAELLKRGAPLVKIVWGTSGYPGDTEYWPGSKNVDYVSLSLRSDSENSLLHNPWTQADLAESFKQKIHTLRFVNKPILILGNRNLGFIRFDKKWGEDFIKRIQQYKNTIYAESNFAEKEVAKPVRSLLDLGLYDPEKSLIKNPHITIEHIFINWGDIQRGDFKMTFDSILAQNHTAIITVEPWRDTSNKSDSDVLQSTVRGHYDPIIQKFFKIVSETRQTVFVRFAHEMEIPIHRYAWQSKDPVDYINAYRHFMSFAGSPNIKKVWGPAGDRGSADWWPGKDMVDFISLAIYGLPDKNIVDYKKQESFSTIFERKKFRVRFFSRPIFITEFGIKGPENYQQWWLAGAAKVINQNKEVFGLSYFNQHDNPKAWGNIKAPDWCISQSTLHQFTGKLNDLSVKN